MANLQTITDKPAKGRQRVIYSVIMAFQDVNKNGLTSSITDMGEQLTPCKSCHSSNSIDETDVVLLP